MATSTLTSQDGVSSYRSLLKVTRVWGVHVKEFPRRRVYEAAYW
ncbi:hypothetical protein [Bacillus phage BvP]